MRKATRDSWKTLPMTDKAVRVPLLIEYSEPAFEAMKLGFIPRSMEDKWFIFYEDSWLYFHRSWTGFCLFKLMFEHIENKYIASEFWAERDESIYKYVSEENDIYLLKIWLEFLLKQRIS
jgi:hypothetical protein